MAWKPDGQVVHALKRLHELANQNGRPALRPLAAECLDATRSHQHFISHVGGVLPELVEWCGDALAHHDGLHDSDDGTQASEACWNAACVVEAEMLHMCLMAIACLYPALTSSICMHENEHELLQLLSDVALDMDELSIYVFGSLCQEGCDSQLRSALEGSMACLLLCVARARRHSISGETIFELAHGDALWGFLLARAVLNWRDKAAEEHGGWVPEDLQALVEITLRAVLCMHKPHLAFLRENTLCYNSISIDARNAAMRQHNAEVASAFACSFFAKFELSVLSNISNCGQLLPELASFLACVAGPDSATLEYSEQFWELLLGGFEEGSRTYWTDLAAISIANPPTRGQCERFLRNSDLWIRVDPASVLWSLSTACVLTASAGIPPCEPLGSFLLDVIGRWPRTSRTSCASFKSFKDALERWRGFGCHGLDVWLASSALQAVNEMNEIEAIPAESEVIELSELSEPVGLRRLFPSAPKHLCCQLDGQLMLDPVRSPAGHLFERSNLSRALQELGRCPITSSDLALSDCQRSPRVRAEVLRWVRMQRRLCLTCEATLAFSTQSCHTHNYPCRQRCLRI